MPFEASQKPTDSAGSITYKSLGNTAVHEMQVHPPHPLLSELPLRV